ncbi:hypothetical protein AVEN_247916-1 [Araneus ventricosus]|uniref:Uncharacterized protein n=1 Tax=Araneus ventricosus TaxID=182803 RepID=A0A4Y2CL59_ARAVE|nr:hypothetical protein AVEN_247916-1 [Araneus ventricosus]
MNSDEENDSELSYFARASCSEDLDEDCTSNANKSPFSDFENLKKGFIDWEHLNPFIHIYETSPTHRHSYVEWKELEIRLKYDNSIDADIEKCTQAETEKWRCVLKCIASVILRCAWNNLPLRGSSDAIGDNNCGVFLSTLELISRYNSQQLQRIENIKSKKHVPSYFSHRNFRK